jgi:hypothetical protein
MHAELAAYSSLILAARITLALRHQLPPDAERLIRRFIIAPKIAVLGLSPAFTNLDR